MRTHVSTACAGSLPKRQPIFGEYPAFDAGAYTFLADYLPWAVGDGMEHRNSSVLTNSASLAGSPRFLFDTAAHEFFHAWNVERIRPRTLEPFDLEAANMSGELWLAEGVTTYYEKLVLQRTGLATLNETLHDWSAVVNEVLGSPALRFRSAEDMSRMAPLVDGGSPLESDELELQLPELLRARRRARARARSRVARAYGRAPFPRRFHARHVDASWPARRHAGRHRRRTVTIDDVRARLAEVAGDTAFGDAFVARYVQGREAPDYAHLLALAGLRLRKAAPGRASMGPLPLESRGSRLRIAAPLIPGTPLYEAGAAQDDEILAIDGRDVAGVDVLEREIQRHAPGTRVAVRIVPRGASAARTVEVTLIEQPCWRLCRSSRSGRR